MPVETTSKNKDKKLTDFFGRRSSPSVSASAPSSSLAPRSAEARTSMARRSPAARASTAAIHHESSRDASASAHVRGVSTMVLRKRARSSDSDNPGLPPFPPSKRKSFKNTLKTTRFDSDPSRSKAVVYITSPLSSRNPSVPRMHNSSVASPSDSTKQVVYSSQSEAELVLPTPEPRDPGKVVEDVHAWRWKMHESSNSSASYACEDAMEVGPRPSFPIRGRSGGYARRASPHFDTPVRSASTPRSRTTSQTPVAASTSLSSSPDTTGFPPLPPTPEPIDPETKTAKIIAEIKARAFAAHHSSDDEQPLLFRELEDSDDDELIDDLPLTGAAKEKTAIFPVSPAARATVSSPLLSAPSALGNTTIGLRPRRAPDHGSPSLRPTRTSARSRKCAPASHLPGIMTKSSTSVGATKSVSVPASRKQARSANPLYALLREKELEDKRGVSCAALRLAEEAVRQGSRETSVSFGDELDTPHRLLLVDEQAAWKAVRESRKSTTPDGSSDVEDFTKVGDRELRMLGADAGEAINKIFAGNKVSKEKQKAQDIDQKVPMGVHLWIQPLDEDMEVDFISIPPLSGHPVLTRLDDCRRSGDDPLLNLILRTGALSSVPRDILLSNMPQLFAMALFASPQIGDAVYFAIRDLWTPSPQKVQMPFAAILSALVWLGANFPVLEGLGFTMEHAPKNYITHKPPLEALKRLLAIIESAGFAGAFLSDDVPNVLLSLVAIGLDPLTPSALGAQVDIVIDVVCNHCTTDYTLRNIHDKVLSFTRQLEPINKVRLVSLFASGSSQTRCIAQRLSYCLLVPTSTISDDQTPPLEPLILLLSPEAGSCELFDVTNESTDYDELIHHVNILSVALIDITSYVQEERNIMQSANNTSARGSPSKPRKNPIPPLELLRKVLEALQGKIVDTRAAHLDRSRTKAAIQRLSMRIHYERMALAGVRSHPRASTLKAYFSPQHRQSNCSEE